MASSWSVGLDLIHSLMGVLCRFRKKAVAITCYIEGMFHQLLVTTAHCNYLRFLWWEHGDLNSEPKEYQMTVDLFDAASSPRCAIFCLKHLAKQHWSEYLAAAALSKPVSTLTRGWQVFL